MQILILWAEFLLKSFSVNFLTIFVLFHTVDIMNRKARLAWEMYLKMETSSESFSLLQLIANDCYKVRNFLYCHCRVSHKRQVL